MKIKTIRVSYTETVSLPGYNNVKPGLSLTADVEDGEDPDAVRRHLQKSVQDIVQEEVNQALERHGRRAKYHDGPTFQVAYSKAHEVVALLPNEVDDWIGRDYEGPLEHFSHPFTDGDSRQIRLGHAQKRARQIAGNMDYEVIDLSDGDLSPLDDLEVTDEWNEQENAPMPF